MSQLEVLHSYDLTHRNRHYSDDEFEMEVDSDDYMTETETESTTSTAVLSQFEGTVATTVTSMDDEASMRTPSPEPEPIMQMDEPLRSTLYKSEFGRNLNNYSDIYKLPADEEELDRLERQYEMLNSLTGHKYVPPMMEVLADDGSERQKAVVDLGSGAGNWIEVSRIIDVARDFPHCLAVAIDLTPMKIMYEMTGHRAGDLSQSEIIPPNLRGEVDDVNLGLSHYNGHFDVVHTRLIAIGVKDYCRLVDEISEVLRPGGLIDLTEVGYEAYDKNHEPIQVSKVHDPANPQWQSPYWAHWLSAVNHAAHNGGGETSASRNLEQWLSNHRAFEDVVHREYWLPIIPGDYDRPRAEAEFLQQYRNTLEFDVMTFLRAGRVMLLKNHYKEDYLSRMEQKILDELREAKEPQYSRIECVYARKTRAPPALELDTPQQ
ncbi:hypothetical protein NP233_g11570 [Leucocoprinus birnbaumii]|uniref:Methyltransferase domain-containing protein n=1 Tax=Leucocoprinus birnbaumii TaxID=56174 RepID=A0AAD5VJU1_9AGAR|nr:hypothetical protein NP233_g11570 [Leucocoprinus birnbaumii]